jgi:hypothetical protein
MAFLGRYFTCCLLAFNKKSFVQLQPGRSGNRVEANASSNFLCRGLGAGPVQVPPLELVAYLDMIE